MTLPPTMIGTPPAAGTTPGSPNMKVSPAARRYWYAFVGTRKLAAVFALASAIATEELPARSDFSNAIRLPPPSTMAKSWFQPFFLLSAAAPAIAVFACSSEIGAPYAGGGGGGEDGCCCAWTAVPNSKATPANVVIKVRRYI